MKIRLVSLLLAALLAAAPAVIAQEAIVEGDPLVQDARQYATRFEVDLDEAVHRLRLQSRIGRLETLLAAAEPNTFAGIWVQHTPTYRVIVQLTRRGRTSLERILQEEELADLVNVVERRTVALSLKKLAAIQALVHPIALKSGLRADSSINVSENRVDLFTVEPSRLASALRAAAKDQKVGVPWVDHVAIEEVERLSAPESYIFGGFSLTTCTLGLPVQSGSSLGIATAAHCNNSQSYNSRLLPFQSELLSGSSDVQWHTAPNFFVTNRIYDGINDAVTPYYRLVTGTRIRANQVVGEFVCKYGKTTGHTCGTITSKTYQPQWVSSANATFIYVSGGSVNLSEGGDSGGPWFSGETAYGIHSGGGNGSGGVLNDSIYMAVDYLAPLGVSVLTTTPQISLGRFTYVNMGDNISAFTGINANEFECGISGLAAVDGDIQENDTGEIIQTYLYKENNHWRIRGDFRSHSNMESWDFDLLCLNKSVYPASRFEYRNLGDNVTYNTGISTTTYECGVSGSAAQNGDIQENNTGDIIQAYLFRSGGSWWFRGDFRTHNNSESWDVDLMCVERWAPVSRYEYRNLGDNIFYNTFISSSAYECGIAGFAARDGDIQENNSGDILRAYLYTSGGTWWIRGDFRSHNNTESWDVDVLCVQR